LRFSGIFWSRSTKRSFLPVVAMGKVLTEKGLGVCCKRVAAVENSENRQICQYVITKLKKTQLLNRVSEH
jgi:hypothetical protein